MKNYILTFAAVTLLILGAGCGYDQRPTSPYNADSQMPGVGSDDPALSGEISSARIHFYVVVPNGQAANFHRITEAWNPATVGWNSFGGAYSPDIEGSVTISTPGWHSADITDLVQNWMTDSVANFGVLLEQSNPAGAPVAMHSSEKIGFSPFLEVCYATMGSMTCDTILPSGDAFIDQAIPDASTGNNQILLLGKMMMPNAEKQALLQFDMPDIIYDIQYSSIAGLVWDDLDQNGIFDPGEVGLSGIRVSLYNCQDVLLDSAVTNQTGSYECDSLLAGDFFVQFTAPDGYFFSPQDQGSSDVLDSDADPSTGRTDCFALGEGEDLRDVCAGMYLPVITDSGCTHGLGYWKHLAGGLQVADLSEYLPMWLGASIGSSSIFVESTADVADILRMRVYGAPSNGITKLYAHLLVAKLNIASGAFPGEIASDISDADAFLGLHSWSDWRGLSQDQKKMVLEWKDLFESYNNGTIGPGNCDGSGNSFDDVPSR